MNILNLEKRQGVFLYIQKRLALFAVELLKGGNDAQQ